MTTPSKEPAWKWAIAEAKEKFNAIAELNGNIVDYAEESYFATQTIENGGDYIQKCRVPSIVNAIVNIATVGLTINPAMKLAYLVPRKVNSVASLCLDISYMGLVKLATDSGSVVQVASVPVHKLDKFKWNSPFELPRHEFDPFASVEARGEIVGVYTAARIAQGHFQVDAMSREEIDKIRKVSRAEKGPWVDWFEEMVKKTGIKRAYKMWPRTQRLSAAEAILNEHEGIEFDHQDFPEEAPAIEGPKAKSESAETPPPPAKSIDVAAMTAAINACKTVDEVNALFPTVIALPDGSEKESLIAAGKNRIKAIKKS